MHSTTAHHRKKSRPTIFHEKWEENHNFCNVSLLNIFENKTSFICIAQYHAYCWSLCLLCSIELAKAYKISAIQEASKAFVLVVVQTPFKDQDFIIEFADLVLKEHIRTPCFIEQMLENGLHIFIYKPYPS